MGFSDMVLAAFKKMGCMSEPRVQNNSHAKLHPVQAAEVEVEVEKEAEAETIIRCVDSDIQMTEGKEEDDSKGITVKDRSSEPKEEKEADEKPISGEACSVASELKEGESKTDQLAAAETEAEAVPSQLVEEEKIAKEVKAN